MKLRGEVEGVRELLTKQQHLVLPLNGWYVIQLCWLDRVCMCCAFDCKAALEKEYGRTGGKRKIVRLHHLVPFTEMISNAQQKWLLGAILRHQHVI